MRDSENVKDRSMAEYCNTRYNHTSDDGIYIPLSQICHNLNAPQELAKETNHCISVLSI